MRLIFVNRYFWPDESATSLMLTDLALALAAAGHEVHVVASRQLLENPDAALRLAELHRGVHIHRLRTTTFGRQRLLTRALDYLSFYIMALVRLLLLLRRGDTVIAKTDPPLISVVAALAAVVRRARLVNWLQDVYPEIAFRLGALREQSTLGRLLRPLRNWSLRRAATNVAVGERMQRFVEQSVPGCGPVAVIHNWSQPLRGAAPLPGQNVYRIQLGLEGKVVFCYSGNLGRAHEFDTIIDAAARLRDRADIHFLIIGGGARAQLVKDAVLQQRLANWSFLPYQRRERLAESLGAADVHLISLNPQLEGLIVPSKVYGVLAAARPAMYIGAADGEVATILRQYDCGLTCTAGDAATLARLLVQLADSLELRRRLGENAIEAYRRYFGIDNARRAWDAVLEGSALPGHR